MACAFSGNLALRAFRLLSWSHGNLIYSDNYRERGKRLERGTEQEEAVNRRDIKIERKSGQEIILSRFLKFL